MTASPSPAQPIVLGIYEKFYLPLQESLRPATKAFILALLPGLEEETGEFFEKVRRAEMELPFCCSPLTLLRRLTGRRTP